MGATGLNGGVASEEEDTFLCARDCGVENLTRQQWIELL